MLKMKLLFVLLGLLAAFQIVSARPNKPTDDNVDDDTFQNDEYPDEDDEDDVDDGSDGEDTDNAPEGPPPAMLSKQLRLSKNSGESVLLPCDTLHSEAFVILWKKNNNLIFQDRILVGNREPRYTLFLNRTLQISNLNTNDTAQYECCIFIAATQELKVVHQLEISTPPKIINLTPAMRIKEVILGEPLELVCEASGIPEPKIVWSREGTRVRTQHGSFDGPTVTFNSIQKDNAGIYQCMADNGIGAPATTAVEVKVIYPPSIKIEKVTVNSAEGYESQLTCIVHAFPKATVTWKKGTETVESDGNISLMTEGNRHILKILRTRKTDFGNYSCSAINTISKTERNIILSGKPAPAEFVTANVTPDGDEATLEWKVESNSPITEYQLQYRMKHKDEEWKTEKPKVINAEGNIYSVTQTLKNLELEDYEAKLRSKNTYGWSSYSHHITFGGKHNMEEEPIPVSENREEPMKVSSSADRIISSILLVTFSTFYCKFV